MLWLNVWFYLSYPNILLPFWFRNDTEEYKTTMTTIDNVVEEHKSQMKRGTPQLNWCDPAVMVSASMLAMGGVFK